MRWRSLFPVLIAVIIIALLIPPSHANIIGDLIATAWFSPVPEYRMSADDHIEKGDSYMISCEKAMNAYVTRLKKYSYEECVILNGKNCDVLKGMTDEQFRDAKVRTSLHSMGINEMNDPETAGYKDSADTYCNAAERQYNLALAKTTDKNYDKQGEIWEKAASMYHVQGYYAAEEKSNTAAAAAYGRSVANSLISRIFEPLPAWIAIAGILGAIFLFGNFRKKE